jgi:hypothetical protein
VFLLNGPCSIRREASLFALERRSGTRNHRDFLVENFQICIFAAEDELVPIEPGAGDRHAPAALILADLGLSIGSLLGVRGQLGISAAMCRSQVIEFSPSHALFITPPLAGRDPIALAAGKNVEIVAIGSRAVCVVFRSIT